MLSVKGTRSTQGMERRKQTTPTGASLVRAQGHQAGLEALGSRSGERIVNGKVHDGEEAACHVEPVRVATHPLDLDGRNPRCMDRS